MKRAVLVGILCAVACGCSTPAGKYFARRGMDLADCFELSAGVAELTPYVRARATDYLVVGAGRGGTIFALGWHGRYGGRGIPVETGKGIPLVWNYEWPGCPPVIETHGPCITERTYDPDLPPGRRTQVADRFWIGAWASWLVSLRVGLNPAEFADFLAGCFTWDMLQDDEAQPVNWLERLGRTGERKPQPGGK